MIVYMVVNLIEERAYVGQTMQTLAERMLAHWEGSRTGSMSLLHVAMRKWNDSCFWDAVVLQPCYSQVELDSWESKWIDELSTREPGVGYNARHEAPKRPRLDGFYRECGMKGAVHGRKGARPKAQMSETELERYREWGRKGARIAKEKLLSQNRKAP